MKDRICPLCDADDPEPLATISAGAICQGNDTYSSEALSLLERSSSDTFAFVRCRACGFLYTQTAPDALFLRRLYEDVISIPAARLASQQPAWIAHQLGLAQKLLERLSGLDSASVLDFGCGYGTIVRALGGPSVSCVGYEYSRAVADEARAEGLDVVAEMDAVRLRAPFDGIVLSDVLEHVEHPRETLRLCAELMKPGGWICVSVPDFSPRRARDVFSALRQGRSVTREVNPWEHLNYFSPATLQAMLERAGFRVDPFATATFGLRPEHRPVARLGNALKSAARMLRFAVAPRATNTTAVAQKP